LVDYAWTFYNLKQNDKGEAYVREALDIYRKRGTRPQTVIVTLAALQSMLLAEKRFTEVEAVTEEALAIANKSPRVEFRKIPTMLHVLAGAKNAQSRYAEAELLGLKAVAMHRRLHGSEHPDTAQGLRVLAGAYGGQQKWADAETALREALAIYRKYYPSGHSTLKWTMGDLKRVLEARGDSLGLAALAREQSAEDAANRAQTPLNELPQK